MPRRPDHLPPRRNFPASVKRAVAERSGGTCEWGWGGCSEPACEVDHIIPDAIGGKPTVENAMHLCAQHHQAKSAQEAKMIARADAMGGRTGQWAQRKKDRKDQKYPRPLSKGCKGYVKQPLGRRRT